MILVLNTKQTQRYQHENRRRGLADAAITDFTRTSAITKHACNLDAKHNNSRKDTISICNQLYTYLQLDNTNCDH